MENNAVVEELKWTTIHSDRRMIHDFGNECMIVLDKETNQASKLINYKLVGTFDTTGMLLETYEQILICFSQQIKSHEGNSEMPEVLLSSDNNRIVSDATGN